MHAQHTCIPNMYAYPTCNAEKTLGTSGQYLYHAENNLHNSPTHPYMDTDNPELIGHSDAVWPGKEVVT